MGDRGVGRELEVRVDRAELDSPKEELQLVRAQERVKIGPASDCRRAPRRRRVQVGILGPSVQDQAQRPLALDLGGDNRGGSNKGSGRYCGWVE